MEPMVLLVGAIVILILLYKLGTRDYDHFSSRGVKSLPTIPFFGSTPNIVFKTRSFAYTLQDLCSNFKDERIVGMFMFMKPILVIKDLELIKRMAVKDFEHFTDHQEFGVEKTDPIFSKNLFSLKGEKWRSMRITLSPAFTSNKLKNMFTFIDKCGQQLADYLQEAINKEKPGQPYVLEMKDLFTRFTNDVIATTAFGIHIDSLKDKENEFYLTGMDLVSTSFKKIWGFLLGLAFPKLAEIVGVTLLTEKEKNFFTSMIHDTLITREKNGIVRPDMVHLLMQARKGELKGEDEVDTKIKKAELTEDDIAAQAVVFFFAGFDTSSTLLSFTSILLATYQDIQKKLQNEIDEVMGGDGQLTYEKVQAMKYLDMVISESLRMFPPFPNVDRKCTKDFTIPSDGKVPAYTVRKGEDITFPVYGLQHDPELFPNPDKFDPERFSDQNKSNIKTYSYMPFGVGPRLCIGQRLALLEAKVAIIHIISRFNLVSVDKTPASLKLHPDSFAMKVDGDFWMGVTPRQKLSS